MSACQAVIVGTFSCPHCGRRWVGRWNGPKHLLTCLVCERRLYDDDGNPADSQPEEPS